MQTQTTRSMTVTDACEIVLACDADDDTIEQATQILDSIGVLTTTQAERTLDQMRADDDGMAARPSIVRHIGALAAVLAAICALMVPAASAAQRHIPAHSTRLVPGCKHGEPVSSQIVVTRPYTLTHETEPTNGHTDHGRIMWWVAIEGILRGRVVASTRIQHGGLLVHTRNHAVNAEVICR